MVKYLEIRDRGTFVPAMAVKLGSKHEQEQYLLRRMGWRDSVAEGMETEIMLYPMTGNRAHTDLYDWGGRTYPVAHKFILENWESIPPGDVIDVEYILGETDTKKLSEFITNG
jgi:hypothetical protein